MIILKVTKNQGFILFLEDTLFEKPQGGQIDPPSVLGLILTLFPVEAVASGEVKHGIITRN